MIYYRYKCLGSQRFILERIVLPRWKIHENGKRTLTLTLAYNCTKYIVRMYEIYIYIYISKYITGNAWDKNKNTKLKTLRGYI